MGIKVETKALGMISQQRQGIKAGSGATFPIAPCPQAHHNSNPMKTLTLAAALLTIPALADEWRGPLPLENERQLQAVFLHLPAQSPEVLAKGRTALGVQLDIANHLLIPAPGPLGETVTDDFETQRLKISWRKGLGRRLEFGAGANLTARNGGILDGPIQLYHDLLGMEGNAADNPFGRKNQPKGRTLFSFTNAAGAGVAQGGAIGLGDTSLWLKKSLSTGRFASAARVAMKVPTGSESKILGSGGFDAGLALDARYQLAKKWAAFGNLGLTKFGKTSIPGAKGNGWQAGLGFEWRLGQRESLIFQTDAASRTVTTGNPFADRTPIIGSIGYKKQLNARRAFWISFSENGDFTNYGAPLLGNIGPDFTLSFGYELRR